MKFGEEVGRRQWSRSSCASGRNNNNNNNTTPWRSTHWNDAKWKKTLLSEYLYFYVGFRPWQFSCRVLNHQTRQMAAAGWKFMRNEEKSRIWTLLSQLFRSHGLALMRRHLVNERQKFTSVNRLASGQLLSLLFHSHHSLVISFFFW